MAVKAEAIHHGRWQEKASRYPGLFAVSTTKFNLRQDEGRTDIRSTAALLVVGRKAPSLLIEDKSPTKSSNPGVTSYITFSDWMVIDVKENHKA